MSAASPKTASERVCIVCNGAPDDTICLTASGRHWTSMTTDDSPAPPEIVAALTAPEHRTDEQARLIADDQQARQRRRAGATS